MISVLVCTYNRAPYLEKMLTSFFQQKGLDKVPYELFVIDNNSSDNTRQVVEGFQEHESLHYVFEEAQGLSCARNRGIAESHGEIVAFLDDDVIVDANWLNNLQTCFQSTHADIVGGRAYLIFEKDPEPWFGPHFAQLLGEVNLGPDRKVVHDGQGLFGLNLSFRRRVLKGDRPFDERLGRKATGLLGGDETTVVRSIIAAGGTAVYNPDSVVGHMISPQRVDWSYFKRAGLAMGQSFALAEPPATLTRRLARVGQSLAETLYTVAALVRAKVGGSSLYEQKRRAIKLQSKKGLLLGRIKRVCSSR